MPPDPLDELLEAQEDVIDARDDSLRAKLLVACAVLGAGGGGLTLLGLLRAPPSPALPTWLRALSVGILSILIVSLGVLSVIYHHSARRRLARAVRREANRNAMAFLIVQKGLRAKDPAPPTNTPELAAKTIRIFAKLPYESIHETAPESTYGALSTKVDPA